MKRFGILLIYLTLLLTPLSGKANSAAQFFNTVEIELPQLFPWITAVFAGLIGSAQGVAVPVLGIVGAGGTVYVLEHPAQLNPNSNSKTERYLARVVFPAVRMSMMTNSNPVIQAWGEHLFQKQMAYSQQTGVWFLNSTEEITEKPPTKRDVEGEKDAELAKKALGDLVESGVVPLELNEPLREGAKEEIKKALEKLPDPAKNLAMNWIKEHFNKLAAALRLAKRPLFKNHR